MARFFAILCLTAVVGITALSAVPASESSRGGSIVNNLQCSTGVINANALNCIDGSGNKVNAAVFGGAVQSDCQQNCTNGSTCNSVKFVNSEGIQQGTTQFQCCTAVGNGNAVNCGKQDCSGTSTSGSSAESLCCKQC